MELAAEIASAFKEVLQENNWILEPPGWTHSSFAAMRAIAGNQPKASRVPPLVPEHKYLAKIEGPKSDVQQLPLKCMQRCKSEIKVPPTCSASIDILPAESQLLRSSEFRSSGGIVFASQAWGIPWSESEFVTKAIERGHPRTFNALLPPALEDAVSSTAYMSCGELAELRARWFATWVERAKELSPSEIKLKENFPRHLKRILGPKRSLLLAEILKHEGYPDLGVVNEVSEGTKLVGQVPETGVFDKCFKAAEISVEQLIEGSAESNRSIFHSSRSSGDHLVDKAVYEKTLEERDEGWLEGPISFSSLPVGSVLSRRFGLKQPNKVRLIDDLSGSFVNMTVQSNESPRSHTTDVVASLALGFLEPVNGAGCGPNFRSEVCVQTAGHQ